MAGKKYGILMMARVPGSYHSLPDEEQSEPGEVFQKLLGKYDGKIEFVRRYWTSAFSADITDAFVFECDDLMEFHKFNQELVKELAAGGDPERFGETVQLIVGVNPDV